VLHASCLTDVDGTVGPTAVVIEPATRSDLIPIIVEAHQLSAREQQVVAALARGVSTAEIATQLHLSPHTVRDHLKAIFAKVGVSSRGELVAELYFQHCAPDLEERYEHA
jgi:DNA-binding CsgD family transcriptional regulator